MDKTKVPLATIIVALGALFLCLNALLTETHGITNSFLNIPGIPGRNYIFMIVGAILFIFFSLVSAPSYNSSQNLFKYTSIIMSLSVFMELPFFFLYETSAIGKAIIIIGMFLSVILFIVAFRFPVKELRPKNAHIYYDRQLSYRDM